MSEIVSEHCLIQRDRQMKDIEKWPETDEGEYLGFRWHMRRPYKTYWCGYVDTSSADVEDFLDVDCNNGNNHDILDSIAHGGLTGVYKGMIGFDCSHYHDFWIDEDGRVGKLALNEGTVYRDHDYVLS